MRLLLDEIWTPTIAVELRRRRFDVIAINEPAQESRYAGWSDDEVFARAQEDGRTIVTDNIVDYEKARLDWETRGVVHHGLVYALNPPFNRHRGDAVIGQMINALEHLLSSREAEENALGGVHYLRPSPES